MTCPDWSRLAAHRLADPASAPDPARDRAPDPLPEAWTAALDHLDRCPECRRRAVAVDPTLVFRSLPRWEPEAGEVEAMRSGVAALRRAHRVAPRAADGPRDRAADGAVRIGGLRISGTRSGWRAAAAAALAAALLSVAPVSRHAPAAGSGGAAATSVGTLDDSALYLADSLADSTVDDIEHPTASVYHIDDEEVGVVMVVDAGLDV